MTQEEKLGSKNIPKLMLELSIPMIVAQFINVMYNLVDRMYIGRIEGVGASALTGLGLCLPIIQIIAAFSAFAGVGGAPLAAIELGKGNREGAKKILGNAMVLIFFFSATLTTLFLLFQEPLLYLFGASDVTLPFATDYLSIYLIGTIFVQISLGLNPYITCQGQSRVAMLSIIIGAITNIILDPIFIFTFNMGVAGAALATIISQGLSAIWILRFLMSEKSALRVTKDIIRFDMRIVRRISMLGVAPFINQSTESLTAIAFTSTLQRYGGDVYVGSLTVLMSIMQFVVIPISGFTNGVQPIISYNYGAQKYDRVRKTIKYMLIVSCTAAVLSCTFVMLNPTFFAGMFTTDPELLALLEEVMPIFIAGMAIFGLQMSAQSTFVGLGMAKISLFVGSLRKLILLIPMIYIFGHFFGVDGVYFAEPIADSLSATTAGILLLIVYKRVLSVKDKADVSKLKEGENV